MTLGATIPDRGIPVPFIDISALEVIERLPGWYGRYFHSPSMTFAHYDFKRGSSIHEHFHPQEEVYEVIEGELELTIDGAKQVARPGMVGIVPVSYTHLDVYKRQDQMAPGSSLSQPRGPKQLRIWQHHSRE